MPKTRSTMAKKGHVDSALSAQALIVLGEKLSIEENAIKIDEELPRRLYEEVHEVLQRLGGTYIAGARKHAFPYDPKPLLANVLEQRHMPPKNPLEFFYSTPPVVEAIRSWLDPQTNNNMSYLLYKQEEYGRPLRILEPSAGLGHLADMLHALFPQAEIICCEVDPYRRSVLEAKGYTVFPDFERYRAKEPFDLAVMNPPFGLGTESDTYIRHIYRAMSMLRDEEESELIAVAPLGFTYNQHQPFYDFFTFVMEHGVIERLPHDAFKEAGTITQTVLLWLGKRPLPSLRDMDEPWWGYPNKRVGLFIEWMGWEYDYYKGFRDLLKKMASGELTVFSNGRPGPDTREAIIRYCQATVALARRDFRHLPVQPADHDLIIDEIMKRFEEEEAYLLEELRQSYQDKQHRQLQEAEESIARKQTAIKGYRAKIQELEQAIVQGERELDELTKSYRDLEEQFKAAPVFVAPERPSPPPPKTLFDLLLSA